MKIIITSGATIEPIDNIRFLTNLSTGKTASIIASHLSKKYQVTYLTSKTAKFYPAKNKKIKIIFFDTFKSLNLALKKELGRNYYDVIIHAAAVSDYSIYRIKVNGKNLKKLNGKLSSKFKFINIILKKNFKIINRIIKYSKNKNIFIVAFKLTSTKNETKIKKAVKEIKADIVIHNDTHNINEKKHIFNIYIANKKVDSAKNASILARKIEKLIERRKNEFSDRCR
ncbi:MAG: hypothetical protein K6357_00040 [Elusimicrobiota bacterium]